MAASIPAGPAPTTRTPLSAFLALENTSGCQPRRYSSPAVAFCVQTMGGPPISQREMHWLQPMHSRMSSGCPSSIFLGRKGSEIDGRAAPMMSNWPDSMIRTIVSGLVIRPTPTTGLSVWSPALIWPVNGFSWFSSKKRDGPAFWPHSAMSPTVRSHRSTRWSTYSTKRTPSSPTWIDAGPNRWSTAKREAMAQSSPTASLTFSSVSLQNRARFSKLPPYSSVRLL